MVRKKTLLEIYTKSIEKYVSNFSDDVSLQSDYSFEHDYFEFELWCKGNFGAVSFVRVTPEFFREPFGYARDVGDTLISGYIKHLEHNKKASNDILLVVPKRA